MSAATVLPPFADVSLLVVGDVMLDRYWSGPCDRVSPEAPVPVLKVEQQEQCPGGAAHVALSAAALGASVTLGGVTGEDEAGARLQESLESAGINNRVEQSATVQTTIKLRLLSRHQQMMRLDFEQPSPAMNPAPWLGADALQDYHALVFSDYGKGSLAQPGKLLAAAQQAGIPILVDPCGSDFSKWMGATLLTPNMSELEAVVGSCADEKTLQCKGQSLLESLRLKALLVTRGEHGMTLLRSGRDMLHLPARALDVYDVTGAGDTVVAVMATSLAAGNSVEQAMAQANLAAGLAVGHPGTTVINSPELLAAAQAERGVERGVLGLEQLQAALSAARARGQRVVFTNGCFDILHAGHVACLEQARGRGDRLVVAVNSDASVRRLKGSGRPLNPLGRRMAVLAALEAVDWVVSFDEDTPEDLLRSLRPDLLVKGGDYRLEEVVGRDIVEAYGGRVELMDWRPGVSTTALVQDPGR